MARDFIHAQYEKQIPSNTFAYFVREALRRLWVSKRISFAAVAMIAISLLIVGLFLLIRAIYTTVQSLRYGASIFRFEHVPLVPGRRFRGSGRNVRSTARWRR